MNLIHNLKNETTYVFMKVSDNLKIFNSPKKSILTFEICYHM